MEVGYINRPKKKINNDIQANDGEARERERERETLDVTSDSVEANDGEARLRWRREAASSERWRSADDRERKRERERFRDERERRRRRKKKSPKVSRGGKEMEKTFNIYRVR
ncbi:hypothetical protein Syun_018834 [Stephania yunnanensis]|uniref:Uncharacterized protein n=1 Tax=Stephania yunnanensis TaxID=152371 RepID=A0AAP0IUX3_9MAGN